MQVALSIVALVQEESESDSVRVRSRIQWSRLVPVTQPMAV